MREGFITLFNVNFELAKAEKEEYLKKGCLITKVSLLPIKFKEDFPDF